MYPQPLIQIEIARQRRCDLYADGAQAGPPRARRPRPRASLRVVLAALGR